MSDNEWLQNLKVGDEVVIIQYRRLPHISTVNKITNTQFVVGSRRYRKTDGYAIGSNWGWYGRQRLKPGTDKVRSQIEIADLISRFSNTQWQDIPLNKLRQIDAILKEGRDG